MAGRHCQAASASDVHAHPHSAAFAEDVFPDGQCAHVVTGTMQVRPGASSTEVGVELWGSATRSCQRAKFTRNRKIASDQFGRRRPAIAHAAISTPAIARNSGMCRLRVLSPAPTNADSEKVAAHGCSPSDSLVGAPGRILMMPQIIGPSVEIKRDSSFPSRRIGIICACRRLIEISPFPLETTRETQFVDARSYLRHGPSVVVALMVFLGVLASHPALCERRIVLVR